MLHLLHDAATRGARAVLEGAPPPPELPTLR